MSNENINQDAHSPKSISLRKLRYTFSADAFLFLVLLFALGVTAVVTIQPWLPPDILWRDPTAVAQSMIDHERRGGGGARCCIMSAGWGSQIGFFLWSGAAGAALCAAMALAGTGRRRRAALFFASAAVLSVLALDDGMMIHEIVEESTNGGDLALLGVYAMAVGAYLFVFRSEFRNFQPLYLALALTMFGGSVLVDVALPYSRMAIKLEDGLKFMGIALWSGYHVAFAVASLSEPAARSAAE
jgi:hypothetical protein